jgi:hypothetical protein
LPLKTYKKTSVKLLYTLSIITRTNLLQTESEAKKNMFAPFTWSMLRLMNAAISLSGLTVLLNADTRARRQTAFTIFSTKRENMQVLSERR